MRISNFVGSINITKQSSEIVRLQKELSQGGVNYNGIDGVRNTLIKLHRDSNVSMLNSQIKSLQSADFNMNKYDINLQEMKTKVNKIHVLLINRENDTVSTSGKKIITNYIKSIINEIKKLETSKLNSNEDLFSTYSEIITGNNQRMPRSFDKSLITINKSISSELTDILNNNSTITINDVENKLNESLAIIGNNSINIKSKINLKQLYLATEEQHYSSIQDPEKTIIDINSAINTYKASLLMISKVQNLSLTNYL